VPHKAAIPLLLVLFVMQAASVAFASPDADTEGFSAAPGYPLGARVGIKPVDRVLETIESGENSRLSGLIQYRSIPCVGEDDPRPHGTLGESSSAPSPPRCEEGEPEGTPVTVFLLGPDWSCEPQWFRKELAEPIFSSLFARSPKLYSVLQSTGPGIVPKGNTGIVYSYRAQGTRNFAAIINVTRAGRIASLTTEACADGPRDVVAHGKWRQLLAPKQRPVPGNATNQVYFTNVRVGVAAVDGVLAAVVDGRGAVVGLLRYRWVPCSANPVSHELGITPPRCAGGEQDGDVVKVFVGAQGEGCQPRYLRSSAVSRLVHDFLAGSPRPHAAVTLDTAARAVRGGYTALLFGSSSGGVHRAPVVSVAPSGGIDSIVAGSCRQRPADALREYPGGVVLGPKQVVR
jgi:hypothetical protein